ncbi:MAG: hypothetical protein QW279_13780, partial [Candidatus Jordarchaeaceae archaeon]
MKKIFFLKFFFSLILILRSLSTSAATIYVDPNGSNTYPYDTWAKAATSIASGLAAMSKGDTLRIKTGKYNEPLNIYRKNGTGWSVGNYYYVRSDDGNGNYGNVIIGGNINIREDGVEWLGSRDTANRIISSNYWWLDGLTFIGTPNSDLTFYASGFTIGSGPKAVGLKITNCTFEGNPLENLFAVWEYDDVTITDSKFNCSGCIGSEGAGKDGFMVAVGSFLNPDGFNAANNIKIHKCSFTGTYSREYGALYIRNASNVDISSNYFYNLQSDHITARWGDIGNHNYYNNIHVLGGTNHKASESHYVYWFRGMTTTAYGDDGPSIHKGHIYNNTIDMNEVTSGYASSIFQMSDDVVNAVIQNNLIIGNISSATEA